MQDKNNKTAIKLNINKVHILIEKVIKTLILFFATHFPKTSQWWSLPKQHTPHFLQCFIGSFKWG